MFRIQYVLCYSTNLFDPNYGIIFEFSVTIEKLSYSSFDFITMIELIKNSTTIPIDNRLISESKKKKKRRRQLKPFGPTTFIDVCP